MHADVASFLGLSVLHLVLAPALPAVEDMAAFGRPCRAVAAVGESWRRDRATSCVACLLDCRPILAGWLRVQANGGWLALNPVRDVLSQSAPEGWEVSFDGTLPHWTWLWVENGQVIIVRFLPNRDPPAAPPAVSTGSSGLDAPAGDFPASNFDVPPQTDDEDPERAPEFSAHFNRASRGSGLSDVLCHWRSSVKVVSSWLEMWSIGFLQHACDSGALCLTSFCLLLLPCTAIMHACVVLMCSRTSHRAMWFFLGCFLLQLESCRVAAVQLHAASSGCFVHTPVVPGELARVTRGLTGRRAVATPCRAHLGSSLPDFGLLPSHERAACDAGLLADASWHKNTLLHQALWAPPCEAFFEASTLLDVLVEHFSARPSLPKPDRAVLCLDGLIAQAGSVSPQPPAEMQIAEHVTRAEPEIFDLDARQCQLPCSRAMVAQLLHSLPFHKLGMPPLGLPRPERFAGWVSSGSFGRSPAPGELMVLTTDGSFDPRSGAAGWAVTVSLTSSDDFLLPGQFVGCCAGSLSLLRGLVGADFGANNAYLAEVAALFWGAVLALRLPGSPALVIRADNISALRGVAGQAQLQDHPLCRYAAALHTALRLLKDVPTYQHVPGHSNDSANELADALAGHSSRMDLSPPSLLLEPDKWFAADGSAFAWLPHVCASIRCPETLPALHGEVMSWSRGTFESGPDPAAALRPFMRASAGCGRSIPRGQPANVALTCATFNALSLLEIAPGSHAAGLHGATGRVKLLCASFRQLGVSLAGLQECRTHRNTSTCQGYRRFASGRDDNACFGVELWVDTLGPVDAGSVTVLYADPTVLVAGIPFQGTPLRVLVAHGPHRAHSADTRTAWWNKVSGICSVHSRGLPWIILIDGNCRVGSEADFAVGEHQADVEDESGALFRGLLGELNCWLPATFAFSAYGPGGTLYQKRSGCFDRSDYVALPRDWNFSLCTAWVEPSISAGHRCIDHYAALAQCTVRFSKTFARSPSARRIDADALLHPDNAAVVERIISSSPAVRWDVDASDHAACLVEHLYRGLADAFPRQRTRMRGQHFSEHTQQLHQQVAMLRHSLRSRTYALSCASLRCAFLAWSQSRPFSELFVGRWLWRVQIRRAADCMLLRRLGLALRRSCKLDRNARLEELSLQIAESPCSELFRAVRQVMRPKKYRRQSQPLPLLRRDDGSVCQDKHEVNQVWRDHFRVLEAGLEQTPSALAASCRKRQLDFEGSDVVDAGDIPTWSHLQAALKHTSPHKACGPDLLPPALCTVFSQRMTEVFWPVMMKAVLRANEPIGLKGGIMHKIPKPSAVDGTTAGFRGILVQSCLSKALHRATRHLAVAHWHKNVMPLQIGGRRGCPASFGHFCTRAFLSFARASNLSAAVVFVDISAAYYGVIREAILGATKHTRPLQALAESLGLTDEDLQMLQVFVDSHPVLREQEAGQLFCEIAAELHHNTWFIMAGDDRLVETFRGTRPGGSLADVVFNILFGKVLARRNRDAVGPFVPHIPWTGERSPWPPSSASQSGVVQVEASDVVYADDLASFLLCLRAEDLPQAISGTVAETVDIMLPHGLSANIGPTKTAAMAAPVGAGSRAVRRRFFSSGKGQIAVLPENRGGFKLDLVSHYKHLGSFIAHDGSMMLEIKHRLAAGRSALKEGKQRLFACKSIPLTRRAAIFRSHVLSAVLSGTGTWPCLNGQEWRLFSGGLISMFRQLLCLRTEGGFRCTESQIIARIGLPGPLDLLCLERLRFLSQMVCHGPDAAWALLSHYTGFQDALRVSGTWLQEAVGSTSALGDIESNWEAWKCFIRASPGLWKSLLKRASQWHSLRTAQVAALESFARDVWSPASVLTPVSIASCDHACLHCKIAFATRQQWGAHAHRVHAYHSRAHVLAEGRTCQACGLQVSSAAKLRTHLRLSLSCVQQLEALSARGPVPADLSTAHPLAPAVPGVGKHALGPAAPEILSPLLLELQSYDFAGSVASDLDERIFDVVKSHLAPLPVLRRTLREWAHTVSAGPLRDAAEDVLLVLHPVHLCDKVSGKHDSPAEVDVPYTPLLDRPTRSVLPIGLPLAVLGSPCPAWVGAVCVEFPGTLELSFEQADNWGCLAAAAACISFPVPPSGLLPVFSPPSSPLKKLPPASSLDWTRAGCSSQLAHAG